MKLYEDEKKSCSKPHIMQFSSEKREKILIKLEKLENSKISYGFYYDNYEGLKFKQYFIKFDDKNYLVFSNFNGNIYDSYIDIIDTIKHETYFNKLKTIDINEKIKERMKIIIGFNNFSFCLRNSEHVFNFVINGFWDSKDMHKDGVLYYEFISSINNYKKLINSFPSGFIDLGHPNDKLYPFIKENFKLSNRFYYLDYQKDTFNIIVLGTTGAGKSNLINILFNKEVVVSQLGANSVTKEVIFLKGTGKIGNNTNRNIIVADTIGFCDTDFHNDSRLLNFIKSRIDSNMMYYNLIIIVIRQRMEETHIKIISKVMEIFKYKKNQERFIFVSTYFNELDDKGKVDEEKIILCEKLSIDEKYNKRIIMMDNTKYKNFGPNTQKEFTESLDNLKKLFVDSGKFAVDFSCSIL